ADPAMDGNQIATPPVLRLTSPEQDRRIGELNAALAAVDGRIAERVSRIEHEDPRTLDPAPAPRETADVGFEDAFPAGTKPQASGAPLRLVRRGEGEVFSGQVAIQRTADGSVAQDFFSGGAEFVVPADGTFFVHCFLDPDDPPQAVMIQFHTDGWKHRAVWGD